MASAGRTIDSPFSLFHQELWGARSEREAEVGPGAGEGGRSAQGCGDTREVSGGHARTAQHTSPSVPLRSGSLLPPGKSPPSADPRKQEAPWARGHISPSEQVEERNSNPKWRPRVAATLEKSSPVFCCTRWGAAAWHRWKNQTVSWREQLSGLAGGLGCDLSSQIRTPNSIAVLMVYSSRVNCQNPGPCIVF